MASRPRTHLSIRINLESGTGIGSRQIALLEAIQATGSITGAARALAISYRHAWLLLEDLNTVLRTSAVATETGGAKGGGTALTSTGARLVELYRAIEAQTQVATIAECDALEKMAQPKRASAERGVA
jgi:molybdate transport system regulatory protein